MQNTKKFYIHYAFWAVMMLFTSGGMIQTLFAEAGFSLQQISTYNAIVSTTQMAATVLNMFLADRIRRVRQATGILVLAPILVYLAVLPVCLKLTSPTPAVFGILCSACAATGLCLGVESIFSYRLHYTTVDMNNYTDFNSKINLCGGVCSIGTGLFVTALSTVFPFLKIAAVMLLVCCGFSISCSALILSMKEHGAVSANGGTTTPAATDAAALCPTPAQDTVSQPSTRPVKHNFLLKNLLTPVFRWFYLPNYLRGLGMGVVNTISVICIKEITSDASFVSGLVTLMAASAVAGSLLCNLLKKKFTSTGQYVNASLLMAVLLPLTVLFKAPAWFAVILFLAGTMYNVIAVIAAVHAAEVADYHTIGMYTSVRMICMYAGQATASALLSAAIDRVPGAAILAAGGLCQAASALLYHLYEKKYLLSK